MDNNNNDSSSNGEKPQADQTATAVPPLPVKPAAAPTHSSDARAAHTPRESPLPAPDAGAEDEDKKEPERPAMVALRFNKKSAIWNFRDEQTAEQPASSSATATPTPANRNASSKNASAARPKSHATPKPKNDGSATTSATRPTAESLAEVLRAHREQQSAAGPVQSTTVVKKEKKKAGDSAKQTPVKKATEPEPEPTSTDGTAPAPVEDKPAEATKPEAPVVTADASAAEKPKKEPKKTPKKTGAAGDSTHVAVARKKNKGKPAAAVPAPAPAVVTTVTADKSVQALRAMRTRGAAAADDQDEATATAGDDSTRAAEAERVQSVMDEITDLLLRYCRGEDRSAHAAGQIAREAAKEKEESGASHATDAAAPPPPPQPASTPAAVAAEEDTDAKVASENEPTAAAAAAAAGDSALGASAEVELYEKLVKLCQREEVTPATLELIRELVQHTRVIPQASRQSASTETATISRRREYVQQIILVLLNQLKQQKLAEEAYNQQQQMFYPPSVHSTPAAAPASFLSSPMAPVVDQSAVLIAAATNRITLFNPQFSSAAAPTVQTSSSSHTPLATPNHHTLKATAAPFVPASQRSGAGGATAIPSTIASSNVSHSNSPSRGGLSIGGAPPIAPSPFPGAFPIVFGSTAPTTAVAPTAPVTLSEAERDVLRNVQQSFHQQQQQQHPPSAQAPAPTLSHKSPVLHRTPGHNDSSPSLAGSQETVHVGRNNNKTGAQAHQTLFTRRKESALFNESTATDSSQTPSPTTAAAAAATSTSQTRSAMNVNAPAFVPGAGAGVPSFTAPEPAPAGEQPWASDATFAEFKKMMDTYYQAQALMRNVKKQQQMLAMAGMTAAGDNKS